MATFDKPNTMTSGQGPTWQQTMLHATTVAELRASPKPSTYDVSIFVDETGQSYQWEPQSVAVDDGLNVIGTATAGDGRWLIASSQSIVNTQAVSLFAASTGSDTTGAGTQASPYRTFAKMLSELPRIRGAATKLTFLDAGPFTLADGLTTFPAPSSGAPPMQLVGAYAQDAAGGGSGTRTVNAVAAGQLTDAAGGLTVDYYIGFVIRRTGGPGTWTRYFVTGNTANVIFFALDGMNGGSPQATDTFVIEKAISEIDVNNVSIDLNGGIIVSDGLFWKVTGATTNLRIESGLWYSAGERYYAIAGAGSRRIVVERGEMRTCDSIETTPWPTRFSTQMPDLLGVFVSGADFVCDGFVGVMANGPGGSGGSFDGVAPVANIDIVLDRAGQFAEYYDSRIFCWSNFDCQLGTSVQIRTSVAGARSRVFQSNGCPRAFDGGTFRIYNTTVGTSKATSPGILSRLGGLVVAESTTFVGGGGAGGYAVWCEQGGDFIDDSSTCTYTSATGALFIDAVAVTAAVFQAAGGSTRRGFSTALTMLGPNKMGAGPYPATGDVRVGATFTHYFVFAGTDQLLLSLASQKVDIGGSVGGGVRLWANGGVMVDAEGTGKFALYGGVARAQQTVTGVLTNVIDPAAKAVLQSIIAAQDEPSGFGGWIDGTT